MAKDNEIDETPPTPGADNDNASQDQDVTSAVGDLEPVAAEEE